MKHALQIVAFVAVMIILSQVVGRYTGGRCVAGDRFWCGVYIAIGGRVVP